MRLIDCFGLIITFEAIFLLGYYLGRKRGGGGGMNWDEVCYECMGLGDDYYLGDDGELVSACEECPFNGLKEEEE